MCAYGACSMLYEATRNVDNTVQRRCKRTRPFNVTHREVCLAATTFVRLRKSGAQGAPRRAEQSLVHARRMRRPDSPTQRGAPYTVIIT